MGRVLIVTHHHRDEAAVLTADLVGRLRSEGHEVSIPADDAVLLDLPDYAISDEALAAATGAGDGFDVAVSVGGDGTMLRTVDLVAAADVPVIGVHVGQLGYLVEVEPAGLSKALERFFAEDYLIQNRMRLHAAVERGSYTGPALVSDVGPCGNALNEAVLEKLPLGHTVRLDVTVDGEFFTSYTADGLIVATPTGSTAYAMSARAPIVAPGHRALVLTPVAPHMLFDRSLVLSPDSVVRIDVTSYRPAKLFLDGRDLQTLEEGMAVVCTASPHPARLVVFEPRSFLGILKSKFGLNDR